MEEIPDESQSGSHGGYFDDPLKGGSWSHTRNNGAGHWHQINSEGFWAHDDAGWTNDFVRPWIDGYKEWEIPMGWGPGEDDLRGRFREPPTIQRFELNSSGKFTVEKFGHSASRNRFNIIRLDGRIVLPL